MRAKLPTWAYDGWVNHRGLEEFICATLYWCTFTLIQRILMFFKLTPTSGQPLYLQLVQQIRHAVESGALRDGDQLPGIRTLAQELVVSPNTIAKAYSELEHEGLLEMRQGSGAFISVNHRARALSNHIQAASRRVIDLVEDLRERDFRDEEIRRMFEAALLHQPEMVRKR
jgi:GntR family transcriptional regulator